VLVQGPQSARYWIGSPLKSSVTEWVTYDARSKIILESAGLSVLDEEAFFKNDRGVLERADALAQDWSARWFETLPKEAGDEDVRPESFFVRSLTFTFVAVLRAFYLLERLHKKEGAVTLWTTRTQSPEAISTGIRWEAEESPLELLLLYCGDRWAFQTRYFDLPQTPAPKKTWIRTDWIRDLAMAASSGFKKGEVLFSGNPALLEPVYAALSRYGIRTLQVRTGSGMRWGVTSPRRVACPRRSAGA